MNRYGNLFMADAKPFQVTAQMSCIRDGWNSSRQISTTLMVGDGATDVVKRLGDIAWLSDDTLHVDRHRRINLLLPGLRRHR